MLILASSSARRLALLENIAIRPDKIIAPQIDEQRLKHEKPEKMAIRLAQAKANVVAKEVELDAFIIAADTIMATKARIFPKAATQEDIKEYLQFFSGRRIYVHTAVSVAKIINSRIEKISTKLVSSNIKFKRLTLQEIDYYIENGKAIGTAGGFVIQGLGESLIQSMSGSYSGIVGLPILQTLNLLQGMGYHVRTKGACQT